MVVHASPTAEIEQHLAVAGHVAVDRVSTEIDEHGKEEHVAGLPGRAIASRHDLIESEVIGLGPDCLSASEVGELLRALRG